MTNEEKEETMYWLHCKLLDIIDVSKQNGQAVINVNVLLDWFNAIKECFPWEKYK